MPRVAGGRSGNTSVPTFSRAAWTAPAGAPTLIGGRARGNLHRFEAFRLLLKPDPGQWPRRCDQGRRQDRRRPRPRR
eukprot:631712-Alexandrium_andersonii.AAC.1